MTDFFAHSTSIISTAFNQGGAVMYVLTACSILAVYIVVYKLLILFFRRVNPDVVLDSIRTQIQIDGASKTAHFLVHDPTWPSAIMGRAIQVSHMDNAGIASEMHKVLSDYQQQLNRHLNVLAGIGSAAPLIGLLGTVMGLIRMFNVLSGSIISDPYQLSGGIAQALITTVSGLLVAIPCILAYHYFLDRIEDAQSEMETVVNGVIDLAKADQKPAE